jgi:hypothetical protein
MNNKFLWLVSSSNIPSKKRSLRFLLFDEPNRLTFEKKGKEIVSIINYGSIHDGLKTFKCLINDYNTTISIWVNSPFEEAKRDFRDRVFVFFKKKINSKNLDLFLKLDSLGAIHSQKIINQDMRVVYCLPRRIAQ